jgi:hypothetical protein
MLLEPSKGAAHKKALPIGKADMPGYSQFTVV